MWGDASKQSDMSSYRASRLPHMQSLTSWLSLDRIRHPPQRIVQIIQPLPRSRHEGTSQVVFAPMSLFPQSPPPHEYLADVLIAYCSIVRGTPGEGYYHIQGGVKQPPQLQLVLMDIQACDQLLCLRKAGSQTDFRILYPCPSRH